MSRLVCVSNRVGTVRGAPLAGGLAVALISALRKHEGLWFGWSGRTTADVGEVEIDKVNGIDIATLDLPKSEFDAYYTGYANGCLWPLFHFRLDLVRFRREQYLAYRSINALFARALARLLRPDDIVWVHDYHLIPLAEELRALGCRNRIGFFLHIPTPPRELLVALPDHHHLMSALLHYDLIGLQTREHQLRFHDYAQHELDCAVNAEGLVADGRLNRTGAFPVGIDVDAFEALATTPRSLREARRMRDLLGRRVQIIGVDRLDYSKGLLRRVAGYERLFELFPRAQRRVEYLQITPISRGMVVAYQDFRVELEGLAAHINGRFGNFDWTPLRYLNRALPQRTLAALYRASRIGLVTPIRDGMNLVAKEYVAAQDARDPGVLVLSSFAGAAEQMREAILVNPYDPDDIAEAIERARSMALGERIERHRSLMGGLRRDSAENWQASYLQVLDGSSSPAPMAHLGSRVQASSAEQGAQAAVK